MTRAKDTPPLSSVSPCAQPGAARDADPACIPSEACAPGCTDGELTACTEPARVRPRGAPPTPLPQQAARTGSRPVIPTPRATLPGREAPGPPLLRAHLPGDQIPLRRRQRQRLAALCAQAPGARPGPGSRDGLWPEGHREQWTVGARPPTALIGSLERPLKLCFPIGRNCVRAGGGKEARSKGIVGDVVHLPRLPRLQDWERSLGGVESLGGA